MIVQIGCFMWCSQSNWFSLNYREQISASQPPVMYIAIMSKGILLSFVLLFCKKYTFAEAMRVQYTIRDILDQWEKIAKHSEQTETHRKKRRKIRFRIPERSQVKLRTRCATNQTLLELNLHLAHPVKARAPDNEWKNGIDSTLKCEPLISSNIEMQPREWKNDIETLEIPPLITSRNATSNYFLKCHL